MVSLIVVTHNSVQWLPEFCRSWLVMLGDAPIIVADSGSNDDSISLARSLVSRASVVSCSNLGLGAAANAAAAKCATEWMLLCNPDLTFPVDFGKQLSQVVEKYSGQSEIAVVAPKLLSADGSLQFSVGAFPTFRSTIRDQFRPRERRKYLSKPPTEAGHIEWASGACLLIRRSAFQAVGGFDEKYFLYVEEVDLQQRLKEAGLGVAYEPGWMVIHHEPNASRAPRVEVQRYAARGMLRYFAKFGGWGARSGYRCLAWMSGRLSFREAFASRKRILETPTGP